MQSLNWDHQKISEAIEDNILLVATANEQRKKLFSSPEQSNFRVYCLMIFKVNEEYFLLEGTNGEQGYIGGAICAERSCLLQLRKFNNPVIQKVVVVTDSSFPIAPGLLCREFMMSHFNYDTPIVMGNNGNPVHISCSKLGDLYPNPFVLRKFNRKSQEEGALNFCHVIKNKNQSISKQYSMLIDEAKAAATLDKFGDIHPLQFGAAVMFEDETIEVSWILKGLEYGCTVDPVSLLLSRMLQHDRASDVAFGSHVLVPQHSRPVVFVMVDQYGNAHAPFAAARALLVEHGLGDVKVLIHNESGELNEFLASSLVPLTKSSNGDSGRSLTHDDFH